MEAYKNGKQMETSFDIAHKFCQRMKFATTNSFTNDYLITHLARRKILAYVSVHIGTYVYYRDIGIYIIYKYWDNKNTKKMQQIFQQKSVQSFHIIDFEAESDEEL